jgi:Rdx family protein
LTGEGFTTDAIEGGKGQFDVIADGRRIFSKRETGRFPEDGEIITALRA